MPPMILAGDVGGTNSRLGLFTEQRQPIFEATLRNAGRSGLPEVVGLFLEQAKDKLTSPITRAAFGVAGPVSRGKVTLTNLQWHMEEQTLATQLKVAKVGLINDMVAHAEGVELLQPEHLITLNVGTPVPGATRAIIAAGTGLGEGVMVFDATFNGYRAVPSEGGHSDFSPRTDQEIALLRFMQQRLGSVSWENVLSGPGTRHLYDFIISSDAQSALDVTDPTPAQITQAALAKTNPACIATMELMALLYGAEAGNLAVKLLAIGGVYIGGGIGTKMLPMLRQPAFFQRFWQRGPDNLRVLLKETPIHLINFDGSGLYGAANYASRL